MNGGPGRGFRVGPDHDPDRYVLGAAVASGAEGILYRGLISSGGFDLDVAIKMLQPRFLPQVDEWHARWSDQVELLRSLQVPGVVRVRDGFVGPLPHGPGEAAEGRTLYLVMNWVEGEPLDEWVRRRPERDRVESLKLLLGVAAALDLMHSGRPTGGTPVVHRDVKPSNILVTDDGTVLVDFGLTRGLTDGQRLSGVTGTPGYLAPEATEAGLYTPASDRYALGGVAYFVLTGNEPPSHHDPDSVRASLCAVPALAGHPEAVELVMAMLDADPARRPPSLANWVGQLRRSSLTGLPEVLPPQAPGRKPRASSTSRPPSSRRHLRLSRPAVAAIAVVLVLVSVAAVLTARGGGDLSDDERARRELAQGHSFEGTVPSETTGRWQPIDPGPLATRGEARVAWTGREVLVVGGLATVGYNAFSDGAAFDPVTEKWRSIPPRPMPGRILHAAWTGEELITFASEGISLGPLTTGAAFNPITNTWRTVPVPPSQQSPTSDQNPGDIIWNPGDVIWTGSRLLAWQPNISPPGALYDPATDQWTPIPENSAQGAAAVVRAVWTGEELAIQGTALPPYGGPTEQRLFLFHPERGTWRASTRPPAALAGWLDLPPVWTGQAILFSSSLEGSATGSPKATTYTYEPATDRWGTLAHPDLSMGSGLFGAAGFVDGRVVVRVGNPSNPLQILNSESGQWSNSGPPPGPVPSADSGSVSTGSSVFLWGVSFKDGSTQSSSPNAAWLWSP